MYIQSHTPLSFKFFKKYILCSKTLTFPLEISPKGRSCAPVDFLGSAGRLLKLLALACQLCQRQLYKFFVIHFAVYYKCIYLPLSGVCRTGARGLGVLLKCFQQCPLLVTFMTGRKMAGDSASGAAAGQWVGMLVGSQRIPGTRPCI